MTNVKVFANGFSVKGHSTANANDNIGKLVCASVSSAVYMTVNTITDVVGDKADIIERDGEMTVRLPKVSDGSKIILEGLKIHLQQLSLQYPDCINLNSEV